MSSSAVRASSLLFGSLRIADTTSVVFAIKSSFLAPVLVFATSPPPAGHRGYAPTVPSAGPRRGVAAPRSPRRAPPRYGRARARAPRRSPAPPGRRTAPSGGANPAAARDPHSRPPAPSGPPAG